MMHRLTEKLNTRSLNANYKKKSGTYTADCIEKLGRYEDLEEEKMLIKLPCKIGDSVYKIVTQRDSFDDQEYRIVTAVNFTYDKIPEIGKTVFLTDGEAEEKLEEMNHERN